MRSLNSGWTLIELMLTGVIVALLACSSGMVLRDMQLRHARYFFKRNIALVLNYSRIQAQLLHANCVLEPLTTDANWSSGARLLSIKTHEILHEWHWHDAGCTLTWRGFHAEDTIMVASEVNALAMNGYFVMQCLSFDQEKIKVSRLGRVH